MELVPNDFNRVMPHKPKTLDIPAAILFKMDGCMWCHKMQPEWEDAADQIAFMDMYTFTVDKNSENATHWDKIKNSLETEIDGFPTIMAYDADRTILFEGFMPSKDIIEKLIQFAEEK